MPFGYVSRESAGGMLITAGQWSFVSPAVRLWNDLSESLARIDSLSHFKAEVKKQFSAAYLN